MKCLLWLKSSELVINFQNKSKNEKGLCELAEEFRKAYQLSPQDYSDKVIKDALKKKEGNFNNAFEELMSFIK